MAVHQLNRVGFHVERPAQLSFILDETVARNLQLINIVVIIDKSLQQLRHAKIFV